MFGAHGSNVVVVDVVHLRGWGVAAGVGADGLCFEHGCALVPPLPGAAVLPASAAVGVGDYSVVLAVAVSAHHRSRLRLNRRTVEPGVFSSASPSFASRSRVRQRWYHECPWSSPSRSVTSDGVAHSSSNTPSNNSRSSACRKASHATTSERCS